jgi:hypothetical protein
VQAAATRLLDLHPAVLIQEQVGGDVELIVGLQRHRLLGSFVMAGLGGVWTEVFDDVAIRCCRLRAHEARAMLKELRGARLLRGVRGRPACSVEAAVAAIERIDDLGAAIGPELVELEINPLIVTPTRAVAVDALMVKRAAHNTVTQPVRGDTP